MTVTVSSKGQVTLPAEARKRLGILPGTKLDIIVREDGRLEIVRPGGSVKELKRMLPKPPKAASLKDMERGIAKGAARGLK